MNKVVLTLTGPSASGKSTLERMLTAEGSKFCRIMSTTTRKPRHGETHGIDYEFIEPEEFDAAAARGEFIESTRFSGNHYAARVSEFSKAFDQGKIPVIVVDPNGRSQIRARCFHLGWKMHDVFLTNPLELRLERLCDRFTRDVAFQPDQIAARMSKSFSVRLWSIMCVEQNWEFDSDSYAATYTQFDASNAQEVCDDIVADVVNLRHHKDSLAA